MARLRYLDRDTMNVEASELLRSRALPNLFRIMAHSPAALDGFLTIGDRLRDRSALDPALRELVILRVGAICNAAYEMHQHRRIGLLRGLTEGKIAAATREGAETALSTSERDVLRFTEAVVLEIRVSDPLYTCIAAQLSECQLVELVMTIGYYCLVCRVLETFQIDIEPEQQLSTALRHA